MTTNVIDKLPMLPTADLAQDRRFVLSGVSWQQYVILRETLDDFAGLRLTYLKGTLEFFMPSRQHEGIKTLIARLLELYALETNTRLYGFGSETYRKEAEEKGLEPDECYCVGSVKEIPDLAIEVNLTSGSIDKLEVYRGLGFSEVWFWENERLMIYHLQSGSDRAGEQKYVASDRSQIFPNLDIELLIRCANIPDQHDAVVEFRQAINL